MKKRYGILLITLFFFTIGCRPSKEMIREAIAETEIVQAYATQTEQAKVTSTPTVTKTPNPTKTPSPTKTPLPPELVEETQQAKTQIAVEKTATFMEQFVDIDWRELTTYTNNHIDETVHVWGRVFNVINENELQIYISNSSEAVYIFSTTAFEGIFDGDIIDAYGVVFEKFCGTNAFGGEICQPLIGAVLVEKR